MNYIEKQLLWCWYNKELWKDSPIMQTNDYSSKKLTDATKEFLNYDNFYEHKNLEKVLDYFKQQDEHEAYCENERRNSNAKI